MVCNVRKYLCMHLDIQVVKIAQRGNKKDLPKILIDAGIHARYLFFASNDFVIVKIDCWVLDMLPNNGMNSDFEKDYEV